MRNTKNLGGIKKIKKNLISKALMDLEDELIYVYQEYLEEIDMCNDKIYSIDELDLVLEDLELSEKCNAFWLLSHAYHGDFNPNAEYFKFDDDGNLQSIFSGQLLEYIDCKKIAQFCVDNNNALYCEDIEDILEE